MRFRVSHTTQYKYSQPASESFAELRVWPQSNASQQVLKRELIVKPDTVIDHYVDYFGNNVEFFSIPYRHGELTVTSVAEVETCVVNPPAVVLETQVGEARQIFNSAQYQHYEFLQPSSLVPLNQHQSIRKRFFKQADEIGKALLELNSWIFKSFEYESGVTDISTPISQVVKERRGVCQDFAHLMLAILRSNGIPARYVSGYIEAFDPDLVDPEMIGAAASHAWVEVYLPGGTWWGLDPTNNQTAGERHVVVAVGRDYNDVAPMRGTYKGANDQKLNVMVELKRKPSETVSV
ncbi:MULTISPECIES: transglutaminase family protein [unclassified Lentimonas]|uniref:transglutaminase family protein n=1 Tax=unclassified Lentimonas TaxID=2630993 RepID=UPI0013246BE7|nr:MULTISPECIES: transglutaminase family protein [unclassified Lentimonas]CAA6678538.1 Protein containing transglutaminase-like domain, putative cysteine protease [Lentimonas sp. CC4]CAA6685770.1 Protein containing transglutaminase-like domain, putative cysteine protease [Lentimonas sp. CC6]CAA6695067.1 Protein containing transglutaminase-like domain, putative cysteine protease [Lentimonas sp. CC19]CAA6697185.1 Protein containing transglutaminase-like domain, putative cysteine protease [Lentimo